MTLIFINYNDFAIIVDGISTTATVLSALMEVYTIPCHDRGHINVMLVLQSCTESLEVLPGSSETIPTSSDGTYDVFNIKVEEDIDMHEEEEEVNVKREEEECIDIKHEDGIYSEKEEDIDAKEDQDVDIKEEVS